MRRHQEQDRARFELVYGQTYPAVCGYVLRRTADPADAADVVAETYLILWRRLGELPEQADAKLWLYGVARRVLANHRRSTQRSTALTLRLVDDVVLPHAADHDPTDRARIGAAFHRLRPADRELLALVGWEGLRRDEIAETLGVSRSVVRLRLHRARQRFSAELDREGVATPSARRPSTVDTKALDTRALDTREALS
ncbi:hypothetical protein acdb102_27500 [Acidothermaceae bacterium B102]|nr:hypothetical protein acdb102_27500 [Acidothermaceae bacterium B102]